MYVAHQPGLRVKKFKQTEGMLLTNRTRHCLGKLRTFNHCKKDVEHFLKAARKFQKSVM